MRLRGVPVVPGVACAPAVVVAAPAQAPGGRGVPGLAGLEQAIALYDGAVEQVAATMLAAAGRATGAVREILDVTATLTRDPALREAVLGRLGAGHPPAPAVESAVEELAMLLERSGGLPAERAGDLRDIGRRLVAAMSGTPVPGLRMPETPSVLVASGLSPLDLAGLDGARVVAVATEDGGPTGHTAVVAREMDIPCVVAVPGLVAAVPEGAVVLVDGTTGEVRVAPDAGAARAWVAGSAAARAAAAAWAGPGRTSDGARVKVLANVADGESARAAAAGPVEGVGLFRTEMCFLGRHDEPSVAEQTDVYAEVLDAFGPDRTVVVRTLDAGSDKPIAFAKQEGEKNPALGVRGLRLSIRDPGLLERQLAAVAAAARRTGTRPWVMAPMVATASEARGFAEQVHAHDLAAGVMVEVPAAALQARRMLEHVDFLSVGTNDLTQYTMAADRTAGVLAHLADAWQPAVLSLVALSAEAGKQAGKPVGVCGEAAADPLLATVLVGMGVTSLSMATAAVRSVGAQLASVSTTTCQRAAEAALSAEDAMAARASVRRVVAG